MRTLGTIIGSLATAAITISAGGVDSEPQDPDATNVGGKVDDPEDWCHRGLSANDGVQISVDYQVKDTSGANSFEMSATPVWLNVHRDDFGSHQEARAVVVERTWDN